MSHPTVNMDSAADLLRTAVDRVVDSQRDHIAAAAALVADALAADGVLHAFGTGHSRAFAMEIAGRAGGLVPANQLAIKDLVLFGDASPADVVDPEIERHPAVAERIWKLHDIRAGDVFLIASNSGGNGATIEMARMARDRGHPVIAVTSVEHTRRIVPGHPSGQRLSDLADVVVDNCGRYGDAALDLPGGGAIAATSTVTGALVAQMIVTEACGLLLERGLTPPTLVSTNVPEGPQHNDALRARYAGRVRQHEP